MGLMYWIARGMIGGYFAFFFIASPIVVGVVAGLIYGDLKQGLIIGGGIAAAFAGIIAPGGNLPTDSALAATTVIPIALATGLSAEQAIASNSIMNAATIFLGLSVGATMTAEAFLNFTTIGIVIGGFLAFALSIAGGIFFVKLFNLFTKKKINPLIGATGLSAVPMASRVANEIALKYDPKNHVLQYCMASNISGVIGSAVAAGVLISFLG